jgi:hypothetical protein
MKPLTLKLLTAINFLLITTTCFAQKEFFRSKQVFTKDELSKFISSITIHDDLVIFNANDYQLYAYNKKDGSLKWSVETSFKSSTAPFVLGDKVYAALYKDKTEQAAQYSLADGKLIKALPFGPLASKPVIKNGILYGTAIYDFGCIVAYDLEKDTVAWSRFIAHGYSQQPYYFENKIMANAEGSNWVELGYDGEFLDTSCAVKANIFVRDIPCVKKFTALSHDGLEINGQLAEDILGDIFYGMPPMLTTEKFTYILYDDKLTILSGKLKIKQQVEIFSLADSLVERSNAKLLKADNEHVWIWYGNYLLQYDHKIKKLVRLTDLGAWQPEKVVLDEENIWLVSGKDGLLYGLSL